MWGALLAAGLTGWLHQLTATPTADGTLLGHGVRDGQAMITTLRHRLIHPEPAPPEATIGPSHCPSPRKLARPRSLSRENDQSATNHGFGSEATIRWAAINTITRRIARGGPATRQQRRTFSAVS